MNRIIMTNKKDLLYDDVKVNQKIAKHKMFFSPKVNGLIYLFIRIKPIRVQLKNITNYQ
jgi:hypothetical protein